MTRRAKHGDESQANRLDLTARQVAILGTVSDPDAAAKLGTTAYAIKAERRARGIGPFRSGGEREGAGRPPNAGVRQTERLGLTMTEPELAEIVAAVPESETLGRWVVEAALMRARAQQTREVVEGRMTDAERQQIRQLTNVAIDQVSEGTRVHADTDDGACIGFVFEADPSAGDVLSVAQAIDALRVMANKRPRVGYPG